MDCYIKQIIIFDKEGEKRTVTLNRGLNIITGNSKTGKSSLIEIVDYCFCSKTSNIPRGKISEFAHLFAVILEFPTKYLVIGRKSYFEGGNRNIYVKVETDENKIEKLDLDYFLQLNPLKLEEAKRFIEANFNLSVSNISESDDVEDREKRKASLREMTSFFFQHQNLVANKHALIYRFDDNFKRKAVIDSFPVFAGWANDEYFSLKREIDAKLKQLRQIDLSLRKKEAAQKSVEDELKGYFRNYYSLIGLEFNEQLSLSQLLNARSNLPDYTSETFASPDLIDRYNFLKREIESKGSDHSILQGKIKDLEETENYANQFQIALKTLDLKSESSTSTNDSYNCPTCGTETLNLSEEMELIGNAQKQLSKELELVGGYKFSYQKEIDALKKQQAELRQEIKVLTTQKDEIEKITKSIAEQKSVSERAIYGKAQLDLRIELMSKEKNIVINDETEELKGQLEILRQKLTQFSLEREYERANSFLANNMNKIGDKLDFEVQLKPLNFHFNLRTFTFTHIAPNIGEIALSEMGSGANWLTCHLALFLSLLHYLAKQKDSVVPSFLFLDQPSQVYFPSKFGESEAKDNDIRQVEKVYSAILDELNEIQKSAGYLPQVIVTDHADNLDLDNYNFNEYVRKRWTPEKDGALI
jgi:hypothetical protein